MAGGPPVFELIEIDVVGTSPGAFKSSSPANETIWLELDLTGTGCIGVADTSLLEPLELSIALGSTAGVFFLVARVRRWVAGKC